MALVSLKETYPDYRDTFSHNNIGHLDDYSVYASSDNKVGSVEDGLYDAQTGQFRYLIVDTGFWVFGKKILLPIGLAQFDNEQKRVYVNGLTKDQVENMPEYTGEVDYDYEERVRGVYREHTASQSAPVEGTAPVEGYAPVEGTAYTRESYSYDRDPALYSRARENNVNEPIRLYEERLVADKTRVKAGEVAVGKRVETETASVSVPVEKERIVIERSTPTTTAAGDVNHAFKEGEVARVEVFEDKADVHKEAVLREEVTVRKESQQEMVSEQATVRREELDINADDDALIDNR